MCVCVCVRTCSDVPEGGYQWGGSLSADLLERAKSTAAEALAGLDIPPGTASLAVMGACCTFLSDGTVR